MICQGDIVEIGHFGSGTAVEDGDDQSMDKRSDMDLPSAWAENEDWLMPFRDDSQHLQKNEILSGKVDPTPPS